MKAIYRLYTESKSGLTDIVAKHFDGATLISGFGLWLSELEDTKVIEIVAEDTADDAAKVHRLAQDIRRTNNQQCVLVTSHPLTSVDYVTE